MFENFQWHRERLGPEAKTIVWCSTIHAARTLDGLEKYRGIAPLDSLSTSTTAGGLRRSGSRPTPRKPASRSSRARSERGASRVPRRPSAGPGTGASLPEREALGALETIAARPIGHEFYRTKWHDALGGLVVFRREEAAHHEVRREPTTP